MSVALVIDLYISSGAREQPYSAVAQQSISIFEAKPVEQCGGSGYLLSMSLNDCEGATPSLLSPKRSYHIGVDSIPVNGYFDARFKLLPDTSSNGNLTLKEDVADDVRVPGHISNFGTTFDVPNGLPGLDGDLLAEMWSDGLMVCGKFGSRRHTRLSSVDASGASFGGMRDKSSELLPSRVLMLERVAMPQALMARPREERLAGELIGGNRGLALSRR